MRTIQLLRVAVGVASMSLLTGVVLQPGVAVASSGGPPTGGTYKGKRRLPVF